jgi:DNA polymerase-3 subunit delta'
VQFKDVIGQQAVKSQLMDLFQHNRLSHALLFVGKEGAGGLPLAIAFAQYLVCEKINKSDKSQTPGPSLFGEEPIETTSNEVASQMEDSCGVCPACVKAAQLIHPDIHFSYPVVTKKTGEKPISTDYIQEWRQFVQEQPYGNVFDWLQFIQAENKQGNITAHECNDIIRKMSLKSFESEYKFLIMWMPEFLGNEGNKLLKLIEEPPPNTLFILVAENEALILPTIQSRTQLVKIGPLPKATIAAGLMANASVDTHQANNIAEFSDGNYHEALEQLKHSDNNWETYLRDWLNSILKSGPTAQVQWVEEISKIGREKQKQFLKYSNYVIQKAVRLQAIGDQGSELENEKQASVVDLANRLNRLCTISQLEAICKELDLSSYYVERNANAKLLFHALTIKIYHIISNKSVILMA